MRELAVIGGLLVGLELASLVGLPSLAAANGGTLRLSRATAGPYHISAWTRPDPPRVGRLDFSVAIMAPDTGQAILGAEVRANAALTSGEKVTTSARLERGGGGNLLLYHGQVELPAAGAWRVLIEAAGPDGSGSATFELDVQPPLPIAWPIAIGLATLSAGALWWARTRRRARPR